MDCEAKFHVSSKDTQNVLRVDGVLVFLFLVFFYIKIFGKEEEIRKRLKTKVQIEKKLIRNCHYYSLSLESLFLLLSL